MRARRLFYLVVAIISAAAIGFAQLQTATILGTVSDSSGAVIPSAKVVVQNTGTSATVELTTDQSGTFIAPSLQVGTYKVTVSTAGFKTFVQDAIPLFVNDRVNLSMALSPGAVTEEITVVGQRPVL